MKSINSLRSYFYLLLFSLFLIISCKKGTGDWKFGKAGIDNGHLHQTKTYSSEVAQKWHDFQLRLLRLPAGSNPYGMNGNRYFAYFGVALYESVVPGMPGYQSLYGQLTDMPAMPATEPGKAYHWPIAANAALAFLTRNFYNNTSATNLASMDSLENALNNAYQPAVTPDRFQRSVSFG